jgi:hypothetical protein
MSLLSRIKSGLNCVSWAMALLGTVVSLSAFLVAFEAFADPTYAETHPAWINSSQYVECGQDCLYQKGNENVTLQAIYIVKKMDNLETVLAGGQPNDYGHVISELKLYCPEVQVGSVKDEDARTCYKRYVQTQLPILRAMKATLIKNEDMTARLKSDQGAFGGSSKASAFQDETPRQRKAQAPDFSREAELMTPEAGARLKYLSQENYSQWAAQVSNLAPKREDFVQTQKSKKDPNDPYSQIVNKIIRDNHGNPVIDEKAFQLAQQEYNAHVLGNSKDPNKQVEYDLTKIPKTHPGAYDAKTKVSDVDYSGLTQPKGRPSPSAIDDISYRQARNLVVESEANLFQRGVLKTQNFPGPQRSPGAVAPAKPTVPGLGYDDAVLKQLGTVKEAVVNPVPKGGANTTYSLTLSPEQLDKQISEFQKSADDIDVR